MGVETKHQIRCEEPYNCLSDYGGAKWARSDQLLDVNGLTCILMEIIMNSDVVLSCGCIENVEELVTKCEDYLDKDTFELFRNLSRDSNDEGLERYVKEVLEVQPEVIGENVRAMNWAVENVREFTTKKDHVMEILRRQPATAKERWGLELEHISRW